MYNDRLCSAFRFVTQWMLGVCSYNSNCVTDILSHSNDFNSQDVWLLAGEEWKLEHLVRTKF